MADPTVPSFRKCPHGIYHPENQSTAHGCQLCNPKLLKHDPHPEKTVALFHLANGPALKEVRLHSYGTFFQRKINGSNQGWWHGEFKYAF